MPIKFEKDKFQCEIVVDPPPQGSELFLGESIVGRVKVHATDPASIRGIILNYTVREQFSRVTMSENVDATARLAQQCGSHLRHRMRCLLLGSTNHPPIEVKAGEYVYPFIISVPDNVPPSCPPVVLGTGDRWCGCCGCNCGPRTANVVGVEHMLSLEIIIPYSFLDKNDVFKPVTVWKPTHPSTLLYNPPRSAQQNSAPTSCAACPCECCSTGLVQSCRRCLETKIPGNFTIEVTNGILALSDPQPIGFSVRGTMRCPFLAQLVRQCRVMFPGHRHPVICKAVLSHCECPPIGSNGMSSGTFPTAHLAANRNSYPATMRGAVLDVSYFVEIQPHFYNEREGCCVDYPRGRKVSVPIDVFHCTSLRAPAPPGQSISVRAMTVPTSYTPPGPGQERDAIELGVVFSYAPPAGFEGDFVPAGPILEPLGPPVWGTLIVPT